jgi:hypothetical protein
MIHVSKTSHLWWKNILRSHRLNPDNNITLFLIVEWAKESGVSVIEDHILETFSWIEWTKENLENDFSYVSERSNQFIVGLPEAEKEDLSCLIGLLYANRLSLSSTRKTEGILVEDDDITTISSHDEEKETFQYVSNGEIPPGATIYLSSHSLINLFGESNLTELSAMEEEEFIDAVEWLMEEEKKMNLAIFRIHSSLLRKNEAGRTSKQSDILMAWTKQVLSKMKNSKIVGTVSLQIDKSFSMHKKQIQMIIMGAWLIILFLLLYALTRSIFGAISNNTNDTKNELIKAQNLIIQSQKLTNNKQAFNTNIKEAEEILFKLRSEKVHMADTQELLSRIEVMKKEVNDIQTVDIKGDTSIIKFNPSDISPLGIYELNKKLTLIGKEGAILWYTRGEELGKITPYPTGEVGKDFHISEDGNVFIITDSNRVVTARRSEFGYVTVTGDNWWEPAQSIKVFNNNVYLLSADGKNIYRYRPGLNGFSPKTTLIENLKVPAYDIWIDGGIYIVTTEWKIERFVSGKTEWAPKGLILNKIPGEYTIGSEDMTKIISQQNLFYVYILSGNRLWIFTPDSRRFQDISALTYVAQLEIQTDEEIRDIYLPRDGTLYITTNLWVYETLFEFVDGRVLIR